MWSEPDSVAYTESVAIWCQLGSVHIVEERARRAGTWEEGFLSIIKERGRAGHRQDQDIVQRSASEQAQYSPSIWYSIFV